MWQGPIPLETMAAQGGSTVLGFVDLMDSGEVRFVNPSSLPPLLLDSDIVRYAVSRIRADGVLSV